MMGFVRERLGRAFPFFLFLGGAFTSGTTMP